MNNIDIFRLTSGLLQFGVAWYALRLCRLFKITLLGWLLFGTLSVMALLSLVLAVEPFDVGAQWGIRVDIVYTALLLVGIARFYPGLGNFLREEEAKRNALDKWESQVKEQWVDLVKTNEKLRQTVSRLETEVAGQKRAHEQDEKNVQALLDASRQNGKTQPPAPAGSQTEVIVQMPSPATEPAEKNGEPALTASPQNGKSSFPADAGCDTEVITPGPTPEPVEQNGKSPLTSPAPKTEAPPPAIGGLDTAIILKKSTPEPVGQNGEPVLTAPRESPEESWPNARVPERKAAGSKPGETSRKKPAKARSTSRARGQKPRPASISQFRN